MEDMEEKTWTFLLWKFFHEEKFIQKQCKFDWYLNLSGNELSIGLVQAG